MSWAVFINPGARQGAKAEVKVREAFAASRLKPFGLELCDDCEQMQRRMRALLRAGVRSFAIGGGDGTISAAANVLAGTPAVLGVLPLGTANDFARSLKIPKSLRPAVQVLTGAKVKRIDLGSVDGRYFLNAASVGLSTRVTERLSSGLKKRTGALAYPIAAAAEALRMDPFRIQLDTAHRRFEVDGLQVVVGNGRFHGGGRMVAPRARLDDHRLNIYVILSSRKSKRPEEKGPWADLKSLFEVALRLKSGAHVEHPDVLHLHAEALRLTCRPPMELDVDGELTGKTPATFEVAPKHLKVYVP